MNSRFKKIRRRIKYRLLYRVIMLAIFFSNYSPRKWWLLFCGFVGKLTFYLTPQLSKKITGHLTLAFGDAKTKSEIKRLTRNIFVMLGKNAGVVLRGFTNSSSNFYSHCTTVGSEHAEKAYMSGRGVIFLTAHLGPFEFVAQDLALRGYNPFIVGTPLKNVVLNKLVKNNRTKFGGVAIDRGKETFRMMKNIYAGGTAAILIDQDTKVKSVFVDFFGKPCSTPVGATVLAMKTGAAIIPVFAHLNDDGEQEIAYYPEVTMRKTDNPAVDVVENTQKLTDIIENEIRKFPEQWVWMHERWKTTPRIAV